MTSGMNDIGMTNKKEWRRNSTVHEMVTAKSKEASGRCEWSHMDWRWSHTMPEQQKTAPAPRSISGSSQLLFDAAEDPDICFGSFACVVCALLPGHVCQYFLQYLLRSNVGDSRSGQTLLTMRKTRRKKKESSWRRNYASVADSSDKVNEVLDVQASRGQILSYTEQQAKELYPGLTIVSLGAIKEGKPNGVVSARVLFDGNNGNSQQAHQAPRPGERPQCR